MCLYGVVFFFQAEDGIRDTSVTGVQTCALPISPGMAELGTGAHLDAPATGRLKKVPSSGGQTKRARATQGTARESAGATAK